MLEAGIQNIQSAENLSKDRNLKKVIDHKWIFNSFKGGEACRMVIIVFNNCLGK